MNAMLSLENFIAKQLNLLDVERTAEIEENKCLQECSSVKTLVSKGVCIAKLRVGSVSTGLFGRSLIHFQPFHSSNSLPTHAICPGDIVGIGSPNSDGRLNILSSGVVYRVSESGVTVAFDKNEDSADLENDAQYAVVKLANDVTYKRLKRILKTLERKGREFHLANVLFDDLNALELENSTSNEVSFHNHQLNEVQKDAVKFALSRKNLAIIHGPPGTGKTTTVVEYILQAVQRKLKVLACAPSNIAVDNLVEKLSSSRVKMVRLGHPARFLADIQKYSLDAVVSQYDGSDVVHDMRKEIDKLRAKIEKTKGSSARKSLWAENRNLLKETKEREKTIVKHVLTNAEVVLCTLTSASDDGPLKHLEKDHFDVCVVDECSQATEVACWIPLVLVKKCVLAGDHHQLPPTIISEKAAKDGLSVTLMERLLDARGEAIKRMLTTQYRMNDVIMHWPSSRLYESKLVSHESVRSRLLIDLPGVENNENTTVPLLLIDTAGCDMHELQEEDEESKGNEAEADLVASHVASLVRSGVRPCDVAVITPYNLQVDLIKARLSGKYQKLEIKSVDGFQGREKEAVVLSLVRSNDEGEVGFLSEDRRINVAVTRAKRHLAVVCDSETVSRSDFLKSFVGYCMEKGEVRTALQYRDEIELYPVSSGKPAKKEKPASSTGGKGVPKKSLSSDVSRKFEKEKCHQLEREDRLVVEEKYETIIGKFMETKKTALAFPSTLTAFERRTVHEISEKLGLIHISSGEGADRRVEIKKPSNDSTASVSECSRNIEVPASVDVENEVVSDTETHSDAQPETAQVREMKLKRSGRKKKGKKVQQQNAEAATQEEDFDALIEQVVKADKTCSFEKCRKCVAVLSQVCQFCRGRFCFGHFIPEAHGCGAAAKAHARSQIRKEGVLHPGSGRPDKKVDPARHSQLQRRLDKKLDDMSRQRKAKPKS